MTATVKAVSTEKLTALIAAAGQHGLTRCITRDAVSRLDPEGMHVITLLQRDYGGNSEPGWCYTRVLMRCLGRDMPHQAFLGVTSDDWEQIPSR